MLKRAIIFIFLVFHCEISGCLAQNTDSLFAIYNNTRLHDTLRLNAINSIAGKFISNKSDSALILYQLELELAQKSDRKKYQAKALHGIGLIYNSQGNIPKALEYFQKSLKIREQTGDKYGAAYSFIVIGSIYYDVEGSASTVREYYLKSLGIFEGIGDKKGIALSLMGIGDTYYDERSLAKALEYYLRGLSVYEGAEYKTGTAVALLSIGNVYRDSGSASRAIEYYQRSLEMSKEIGDKSGIAMALDNIGVVYQKQGDLSKALNHYNQSMVIAKEVGYPVNIRSASQHLFALHKEMGNPKLALENYELYIQMSDSVNNQNNQKAVIQSQFKYEYEKRAAADSVKVAEEKKVAAARLKQEQTQRYALFGGLVLVAVFGAFMFNRFKVTQKQKNIIEAKEKQTQEQNAIISQQKHLIEERHKEVTDSINYAERIQRSFLATKDLLDANLREYFIWFKPKDVVSGDFFWAARPVGATWFYLCTADSTGHGVPGAIMSLLNITSLEKVIETEKAPSRILNKTRDIIIDRLKKDGSAEGGKDGMDCSLCAFDFVNMKLYVAAAHNPVWIVRTVNDNVELIKVKPDKMPVGKHDRQDAPFTQHEINLQKGDVVYTLTDGFPDQFGGPKGKKFMIKNLQELLVANSRMLMQEQKALLEKTFSEWAGSTEQVDDITIIGIRI